MLFPIVPPIFPVGDPPGQDNRGGPGESCDKLADCDCQPETAFVRESEYREWDNGVQLRLPPVISSGRREVRAAGRSRGFQGLVGRL